MIVSNIPPVTIIGRGRVGSALFNAMRSAELNVVSINSRSLVEIHPQNLVFICVADDAIQSVSEAFGNHNVIHTSGNYAADILRNKGLKGSFHPIQSFTNESDATSFNRIYVSIQGDEGLFPIIRNLATMIGSIPIILSPEHKQAVHIAAVFLSNFVTALHLFADNLPGIKSLPVDIQRLLEPLTTTTLQNIRSHGCRAALTGPVARKDSETIRQHLELLHEDPELQSIYRELSVTLWKMTHQNNDLRIKLS